MYQESITQTDLFEQLCSLSTLQAAFKAVRRNHGAPGIDGQTVEKYEEELLNNLETLKLELHKWTYKPKPVKRVEIPKPNGGTRMLGIPCVRDRVVQAAIKQLLEPIFDPEFSQHSYGFRPERNQQQAVQAAKAIIKEGKGYVVDIDLKKFFDTIPQDRLIYRVGLKITDNRILRLIGLTLRSGIMANGIVQTTPQGSVQGSPLSPLLSNIVLDELDKELESRGLSFCRFADDCNIFVKTEKAATRVMENVSKFIKNKLKLEVNQEKSKIGPAKDIKFLGLTIIACTIAISMMSMNRAMAKVKELTPRGTHMTIEQSIKQINNWYVGWANYYAMTEYPSQLLKIEAHIRRRLRSRIVRQQKTQRNLYNRLVERGVSKRQAKVAFSNRGSWALSHTKAIEKAYPNKWFEQDLGLKIKSKENRPHWFHIKRWIKVS